MQRHIGQRHDSHCYCVVTLALRVVEDHNIVSIVSAGDGSRSVWVTNLAISIDIDPVQQNDPPLFSLYICMPLQPTILKASTHMCRSDLDHHSHAAMWKDDDSAMPANIGYDSL